MVSSPAPQAVRLPIPPLRFGEVTSCAALNHGNRRGAMSRYPLGSDLTADPTAVIGSVFRRIASSRSRPRTRGARWKGDSHQNCLVAPTGWCACLGRLQRLRTVKWATRPPVLRTNWRCLPKLTRLGYLGKKPRMSRPRRHSPGGAWGRAEHGVRPSFKLT